MDKGHKKVCSLTDSLGKERKKEKEGYFEAPGAEILQASMRKSSRLQIKNKLLSCSQAIAKSHKNTSKHTMKSLKTSLDEENPISDIKMNVVHTHKNEKNGELFAHSASVVPSFKYHIEAKDGVRLIVDLNLKRSDWLKSMEKTFCVCQNHLNPEYESFKKEVECLGDRNKGKSSSPDKTTLSDASMNSYVQNKLSTVSGKTHPSMVEKEVMTVSGSKCLSSKIERSSEYLEIVACSSEKDSSYSRTGKIYLENGEMISSPQGMDVSGEENAFADGPTRKKADHKSGQSHERILRSTKLFGRQLLESGGLVIRRSSRLYPKAVT